MKTARLEAFSDGVIAVIITVMVLELKVPHVGTVEALLTVVPSLSVYALSFAVVAIMWVNHHQFLDHARRASAALLWANNLLLFCMSLIPFVTAYAGLFPAAEILVTGVEDPDTRAHSANESLHLATFERACLAEALLLSNLADG